MRILYVADDGKQFDNEYDCLDYEFGLRIKDSVKHITIFNEDGEVVCTPIASEDTYDNAEKIVVTSMTGVNILHQISDYTGFSAYESIDSPGIWLYNKNNFHFKKIAY
jgi:TATA-box binding protein (TBP) (component of TFIID and TFIIIB)